MDGTAALLRGEEGVLFLRLAHGRVVAVTGIEDRLVGQGIDPFLDVVHEDIEVLRAVGPSRPSGEDRVSDDAVSGQQEGRARGGMPRTGQECPDLALAEPDRVTFVDVEIAFDAEVLGLRRGDADRNARRLLQLIQRLNVVGVAVRHQDVADVRPLGGGQDLVGLEGCVHDDAVIRFLADQDVDVVSEISDADLFDEGRPGVLCFHGFGFSPRGLHKSLEYNA